MPIYYKDLPEVPLMKTSDIEHLSHLSDSGLGALNYRAESGEAPQEAAKRIPEKRIVNAHGTYEDGDAVLISGINRPGKLKMNMVTGDHKVVFSSPKGMHTAEVYLKDPNQLRPFSVNVEDPNQRIPHDTPQKEFHSKLRQLVDDFYGQLKERTGD